MRLIYHYCDSASFLSIIQRDCIWLGNVLRMNDRSEVNFFVERAMLPICTALDKHNAFPAAGDTFANAIAMNEYYAACFSTEADDLYQWQAYGQRGAGFAIGFDPDALCASNPYRFEIPGIGEVTGPIRSSRPSDTIGISKVKYADHSDIHGYVKVLEALAEQSADKGFDAVAAAAIFVMKLSAVIKNKKFQAENEWRLLYAPTVTHGGGTEPSIIGALTERKWRLGRYGLAPYFEYPGVKQAIRHIVCGPVCTEGSQTTMFRDFLHSYGLGNYVTASDSEATLR